MPAAVLFPDIEAWAVTYLAAALAARTEPYTTNVRVSNTYTGTASARQVVIRRDGGQRDSLSIEQPRLGIRVWAATNGDATDLALMVAALLQAAPDGTPVVRSRQLSGPSSLPEENGLALRYLVVELMVRGTQLTPA